MYHSISFLFCSSVPKLILSLHIAILEADYVLDGENETREKKGRMEWVL